MGSAIKIIRNVIIDREDVPIWNVIWWEKVMDYAGVREDAGFFKNVYIGKKEKIDT